MTDREYVEKNMYFSRSVNGHWVANFTCADGYAYSVGADGTARIAKPIAKRMLIEKVLVAGRPIQA